MKTHLLVVTSESGMPSVPPAPESHVRVRVTHIRLTGSYELHEDDTSNEDVMFHPTCEATSCQNCGAYADRSCALLYGLA